MTDRVCIIGAGASGLVSTKTLKEWGVEFDGFELGSGIGGNWQYDNDNGRSAAYDSLHIDTSKDRMAFADFPMPAHYPNYPHHSQVLAYFESYARHFELLPRIRFRSEVERVEPLPDGGFSVTVHHLGRGRREQRSYGAVLVCNGHHWDPKLPHFPGEFTGRWLHSRHYRSAAAYAGKTVLVVGIGNSGVDIACDCAHAGARTLLSSRRSAHIIPRHILGRPADRWVTPLGSRLPLAVQRSFYGLLLYLARGNQENYGVPRPAHRLLSEHPTLSAELLDLVSLGEIQIKPNVAELLGNRIRFADGSEESTDVVIYATGYQFSFPFFDPAFITTQDNELPLYRHVVHPDFPGLYFIGLVQPLGAIMPLAELQARWVAGLLTGELELPSPSTMRRTIERERRALARRYVASTRHTVEVDFFPYKRQLEREIRRRR